MKNLEERLIELEEKVSKLEKEASTDIKVYIEADSDSQIPFYAHRTDAGMDLIANEDIEIPVGKSRIIKTGIKIALPEGVEAQVRSRSGVAAKTELIVANSPGTIDAGYRGEVGVILFNNAIYDKAPSYSDEYYSVYDIKKQDTRPLTSAGGGVTYVIRKGDRIAQIVFNRICKAEFIRVDDINFIKSDGRGNGGYGSTGVN